MATHTRHQSDHVNCDGDVELVVHMAYIFYYDSGLHTMEVTIDIYY